MTEHEKIIGVVSDTHGLLRPQVFTALAGADLIIHAGDIGRREVIVELSGLAPVVAVTGNIDKGPWTEDYAATRRIEFAGYTFYVLHNLAHIDIDPAASGVDCVISGHSHKAIIETKESVLYANPGSCGPRRFRLPVSVGRIAVTATGLRGEIISLE